MKALLRQICLAILMCIVAVPAFAYQGTYDPRFKVTADIGIDPGGLELWENKLIHASCSWSVQVENSVWDATGKYPPGVKATIWIEGPGVETNWNKKWKWVEVDGKVPAGAWPVGTTWKGQLGTTLVPQKGGIYYVYCCVNSTNPSWISYVKGRYKYNEVAATTGPVPYCLPFQFTYYVAAPTGRGFTVAAPQPFTHEDFPIPEITMPVEAPGGVVLTVDPQSGGFLLGARIPPTLITVNSPPDKPAQKLFWDWAKTTKVFDEHWNMRLLKRQPSGMFAPVSNFSGSVTAQNYQVKLAPNFFYKDGPGVYRLETWLSQEKTPKGTVKGKSSYVDFELQFKPRTMAVPPGGPLIPTQPKKEPPPTVKPSAGIIAAAAKPNLSVTGVQVKIEPNCQPPQPAMTAIVTIKNTGGALPANKGTIFVKEQGGTNLGSVGSAGIQIPAIGAGQTQVVNIPAITSQPYSSLSGAHQLQVILNPLSEGSQLSFNKPEAPYMFSAVFPGGHCKPTQRQPPQAEPKPAQPQRR